MVLIARFNGKGLQSMDETFDRPTAEKPESTSNRWSRDGFFVAIEHDIQEGKIGDS